MATGALKVTIKANLTGLGEEVSISDEATMTVPTKHQEGYTITKDQASNAVQLFAMVDHITLAKIYGVYIKSEVGTIYILLDDSGTTSLTSANSDLALKVGEACWLPINAANNAGLVVDGSAATDAFSWMIVGSA